MTHSTIRIALVGIPSLFALASCSAQTPATVASSDFQHDVVLSMELTVPAGTELHQCQFAVLPNSADFEAISFSHQYTIGSHHFLVLRTDLDSIPPDLTGQYDCTYGNEPIMTHSKGVLYGAQTPIGHFPLPSGVGFRFTAHQVVILQAHYLNATADPIDAKIQFGIDAAAPGTIHTEAGYMFFYDPYVYVPAGGTERTGLGCHVKSDITIISASSHYHQRGTDMKVWNDVGGAPASAPFFETHDWQHPVDFRGPLSVSAGSTLRFYCDYLNPDPVDVYEGPNAKTSEMCVFGGLYYPKQDTTFENCDEPSVVTGGTTSCLDLARCVAACPSSEGTTGPCWQKCVASGCDGTMDALMPLVPCVQKNCRNECSAGECEACAASQCAPQLQVCMAKTCSP